MHPSWSVKSHVPKSKKKQLIFLQRLIIYMLTFLQSPIDQIIGIKLADLIL